MHVRWRGLELPAKVTVDPLSRSATFARFVAEPFERGFGITVGNSLRRILLSSLEGAAITKVTIRSQGKLITHEFSTIPGILEDVTDILLNLKGLIVSMEGDEPVRLRLAAEGPGDVTAELIEGDASVVIYNQEKLIATLTEAIDLECEFEVRKGRGYQPASEQYARDQEQVIGEIPIDAIFSPVQRVRYACEDTRVGQRTNYQKLVLDVWTNGTVTPEMAVVEAAKIMRKHLNPFVHYEQAGESTISNDVLSKSSADEDLFRKLATPISQLELSMRASNCLQSAQILTLADLVTKTEDELLGLRAFGKTSLREVRNVLEPMGLDLGMQLPDGYVGA